MKIGEKIYSLRKQKNLSQEELGDLLNVSRQTVSKWELGESSPDFDKIVPLCEVFGISTEELLRDKKITNTSSDNLQRENKKRRAIFISSSIFLYFLAISSVVLLEETFRLNDGIVVSIFLTLIALATVILVFGILTTPSDKKDKEEPKTEELTMEDRVIKIASIVTTAIYLLVSFLTMAWHITWLLWIVYAVVVEIIKLIFVLKENKNEK